VNGHESSSHAFSRFTHAIVRPPARNFAEGLTTVDLGTPDVDLALAAHARYCAALERNGCALVALPADERYPDSTFVEDTALIIPGRGAILTRPGAESRVGEVDAMRGAVSHFFPNAPQIASPGTLDAGDVCEAGTHVFIGISHRTNADGARQLADWLTTFGITSSTVDIRRTPGILHLKSGVCAIEPKRLVAIDALAEHSAFDGYEVVRVIAGEEYAANCVRVNDVVFVADGFPTAHASLRALGYTLELLDMREYEKMDGGLSCLSLRF
jgi:dimethylargininase